MICRFSWPVSSSWMAADWPASPIDRRTAAASRTTSWPSTRAFPPSGSSSVVRIRTAVVFPAPLGPSTPSTVPRGTDRSIPRSACTSPNDLVKSSTRIAGCSPTPLTCDIHPPVTPRKIHRRPRTTNLPATRRTRRTKYLRAPAGPPHGKTRQRARIHREPEKEQTVPDETRHESADLDDYSVQEPADSLTGEPGEPGDDPLDRGVAPPERWSAVIRSGSDGGGQESLDQLLA